MAIGLSAKQKKELAAMLPNVEDSVASLKRLIADAKDRTKALAKLDEAEQLQRRHANEVGIPFNEEAFARRRAELTALPKTLTVEEGQLASFTALQRAIGVVAKGPYTRAGRGTPARGKKAGRSTSKARTPSAKKAAPARAGRPAKKSGAKAANAPVRNAGRGNQPSTAGAGASRSKPVAPRTPSKAPASAPEPVVARIPVVKPLPLALGS